MAALGTLLFAGTARSNPGEAPESAPPEGQTASPAEGTPEGDDTASEAPACPVAKKAPAAPLQPWKGVFYDNDFSYKNQPNAPHFLGEEFKDISLGELLDLEELCGTTLSAGGEVRYRYMDESNRLRPGGPARGMYDLWRWRQYLDLKVGQEFRVYGEMIEATMNRNPLPTTGIDVNHWDLQQLFADVQIGERDDKPIYFRVGRQELLYGSQRLVSPLDWANTRRNFEGLKIFSRGDEWDFDVWTTQTVNTATLGDGPVSYFDNHFDTRNHNHTFSGAWWTYKAVKEQTFDVYWLWDINNSELPPGTPAGNRHTLASRWLGHFPVADAGETPASIFHGEIDGGYQFGNDHGKEVDAGFFLAGVGHTWKKARWEPEVWLYWDWASGNRSPGSGTTHTFAQLYGFTHFYMGLIDNIARQNISDINGRVQLKPFDKTSFQAAYHFFNLATPKDVLYTITGQPLGKPNTGTGVGQELDLQATYTFSPNLNVQMGYYWFWNGTFIQNNAPRGPGNLLFVQTTLSY